MFDIRMALRVFEYDARRARTMPVLSNSTYYACDAIDALRR